MTIYNIAKAILKWDSIYIFFISFTLYLTPNNICIIQAKISLNIHFIIKIYYFKQNKKEKRKNLEKNPKLSKLLFICTKSCFLYFVDLGISDIFLV